MTTTTDLQDFGFRELRMAAALLTAYCESPPEFLSSGVHLMMNMHSGCVFLTDEDFSVAMMSGDTLEQFHSCPEIGKGGRYAAGQAAAKSCRFGRQFQRNVR